MYSYLYYSKNCLEQNDPLNELMKITLPELFSLVEYSTWLAIIGKFLNVSSTFAWNYMDLFVMLISLGLSSRFKQINVDLQRVKGTVILVFFLYEYSILKKKLSLENVRGVLGIKTKAIPCTC